jgi:inorganic pyrophosphatase
MKRFRATLAIVAGSLTALAALPGDDVHVRYESPDALTLVGDRNLVSDFPARVSDDSIHVVVEIPTGTTAKWEVDKVDGALRWEIKNGAPRVVRYLGYPGNYGMVPRTLLAKEDGGDGDPLDVIVLGPALERGAVVHARLIGVLELLDGGEQDDKLLAVQEGTALAEVRTLAELDRSFPGVTTIVETWFANYKGPGEMESRGFGDVADANAILERAIAAYEKASAAATR